MIIDINWAAAGVTISILFGLFSLSAWVGMISEKVKNNGKNINKTEQTLKEDRNQNRYEHEALSNKMDGLRELIAKIKSDN